MRKQEHARTHTHGANYNLPPASRAGDHKLGGRGCGRGGEVNKLSAGLSRSALEPVNESM